MLENIKWELNKGYQPVPDDVAVVLSTGAEAFACMVDWKNPNVLSWAYKWTKLNAHFRELLTSTLADTAICVLFEDGSTCYGTIQDFDWENNTLVAYRLVSSMQTPDKTPTEPLEEGVDDTATLVAGGGLESPYCFAIEFNSDIANNVRMDNQLSDYIKGIIEETDESDVTAEVMIKVDIDGLEVVMSREQASRLFDELSYIFSEEVSYYE